MPNSEPTINQKPDQEIAESHEDDGFQVPNWMKLIPFYYLWYFPFSRLRIGYEIDSTKETIKIKERRLRTRISLFLSFNLLRSFLLALAFTWPVTLSPLIDVLGKYIPNIIWEIIEKVANTLQEVLTPFNDIIESLQGFSKFFNLFNPSFAFVAGWWVASQIKREIDSDKEYKKVEIDRNLGTNDFISKFGQKFLGISSNISPWFVLFFMQFTTFLFLIRGARSLIYELQTDKQCDSREKKLRDRLEKQPKIGEIQFVRTQKRWGNDLKWRFLPEILLTISQLAIFIIPIVLVLFGGLALI